MFRPSALLASRLDSGKAFSQRLRTKRDGVFAGTFGELVHHCQGSFGVKVHIVETLPSYLHTPF